MPELLAAYTLIALLGPLGDQQLVHLPQLMPFADHYYLWKGIGFAGLGTFQARWVVQWIHSEKHKESRIPVAFWWLSLAGSLLELFYFLRQQDSVGICGYVISAVPYTRNLMLVYRKPAPAPGGFEVIEKTAASDKP